jgi:hypothetical protein
MLDRRNMIAACASAMGLHAVRSSARTAKAQERAKNPRRGGTTEASSRHPARRGGDQGTWSRPLASRHAPTGRQRRRSRLIRQGRPVRHGAFHPGWRQSWRRRFGPASLLMAGVVVTGIAAGSAGLAVGGAYLAVATGVDHLVAEFGVARQDAPVDRTGGGGDLAVAAQ